MSAGTRPEIGTRWQDTTFPDAGCAPIVEVYATSDQHVVCRPALAHDIEIPPLVYTRAEFAAFPPADPAT